MCITTEEIDKAYNEYLCEKTSIRFCREGEYIPNIEMKFPESELELWALKNRIKVMMNMNLVFISPIELQISYKFFLGSEKDIEDAKYLYLIFKDKVNLSVLNEFNRKLEIEDLFNKHTR